MSTGLFIGHLPRSITEGQLTEALSSYAKIEHVKLLTPPAHLDNPLRAAKVYVASPEDANSLMLTLDNTLFDMQSQKGLKIRLIQPDLKKEEPQFDKPLAVVKPMTMDIASFPSLSKNASTVSIVKSSSKAAWNKAVPIALGDSASDMEKTVNLSEEPKDTVRILQQKSKPLVEIPTPLLAPKTSEIWNVIFSEQRRVVEYISDPYDGHSTSIAIDSIAYTYMEERKGNNMDSVVVIFGAFTEIIGSNYMIGISYLVLSMNEHKKIMQNTASLDNLFFYIGEMESDSYLKCKSSTQLPVRVSRMNKNIPSECLMPCA